MSFGAWGSSERRLYLWLLLAVSLQALLTPSMAQFLSKGLSFLRMWWTLCVNLVGLSVIDPGETGSMVLVHSYK